MHTKRVLFGIWLVIMAGLGGGLPAQAQTAPISDTQLLQAVENALKAKDKAAILALFNWDGVADWVKADQSNDVADWLTRDLKDATTAPLPKGFSSSGEHGNLRYHFNVEPAGIMQLGFTDGYGFGYPYGKKGDALYLAGVITEESPLAASATNDLLITVRTPDGQPVAHARVEAGSPPKIPWLHFSRFLGGKYLADGKGQFYLPATATNQLLGVANADGFGYLRSDELTNQAVMVVRPWGHIDGQLKNLGEPVANVSMELTLDRDFYAVSETPPARLVGETIRTDAQGRFAFDSVPPMKLVINRHDDQTPFGMYVCSLSINPGETNHLHIDRRGRSVTGHFVPGPGLDAGLNLSNCSATLKAMLKPAGEMQRYVYCPVSTSGAFHADLVEPGDYQFTGDLRGDSGKVATFDPVVVHVPEQTSVAAGAPMDLGTFTLKAAIHLKRGDLAPDFNVNDLDGKSLKLSDYRGKYVLVDFWATWCGPCVGETPNMKATYDAFGKDKRFAMISLSLDADSKAPKRFALSRDIAWTQGLLGDWSNDKITGAYGVDSIPAIFLIGPDGKVVGTNLRGPKIKDTVAAALTE
jgi:peroxiredoxin